MNSTHPNDLERQLAAAQARINALEQELRKCQEKHGQYRSQLVGSVAGRHYTYVLVVQYDWAERKWGFWVHQNHRAGYPTQSGHTDTATEAKAEARKLLEAMCAERKRPPDASKVTAWQFYPPTRY